MKKNTGRAFPESKLLSAVGHFTKQPLAYNCENDVHIVESSCIVCNSYRVVLDFFLDPFAWM